MLNLNFFNVVFLVLGGSRHAAGFANSNRPYIATTSLRAAEDSMGATIEKSDEMLGVESFDSILRSRRSINSFLSDLPRDWEQTLEDAIESAIYAPNHRRTEPWRFHLLGPEAIRKVCELNAAIVIEKKGAEAGKAKLERWLKMPGWLVVTCKTKDGEGMEDPGGVEREDYAAVCCAVQNLCLSLHNAGMGTKWTSGPVNFDERFQKIVGFDKDEYVVGTVWFGTPEKRPEAPKKKISVNEVLRKTS